VYPHWSCIMPVFRVGISESREFWTNPENSRPISFLRARSLLPLPFACALLYSLFVCTTNRDNTQHYLTLIPLDSRQTHACRIWFREHFSFLIALAVQQL